jgi:hypothetical protein
MSSSTRSNHCSYRVSLCGRMTFDLIRSSGKSFGLSVTIKSASPDSAQRQNASSLGSGEISTEECTLTASARSRIRLMTVPMRFGLTPRRFRTSLYSSKISSVINQTKLFRSAHSRSKSALGFRPKTKGSLNPEIPATSTLVSTTARRFRFLDFGGNGNLRRALFSSIGADGA